MPESSSGYPKKDIIHWEVEIKLDLFILPGEMDDFDGRLQIRQAKLKLSKLEPYRRILLLDLWWSHVCFP